MGIPRIVVNKNAKDRRQTSPSLPAAAFPSQGIPMDEKSVWRDRKTRSTLQDKGEVILTAHGITTNTDTPDEDKASGEEVVVLASFSLFFFALPSPPPTLAQRRIHGTPTTIATTDINDQTAGQTSLPIATVRTDAAARAKARVRGPPTPMSPIATKADPNAVSMTTRDAHKQEEEAKKRFATSMQK